MCLPIVRKLEKKMFGCREWNGRSGNFMKSTIQYICLKKERKLSLCVNGWMLRWNWFVGAITHAQFHSINFIAIMPFDTHTTHRMAIKLLFSANTKLTDRITEVITCCCCRCCYLNAVSIEEESQSFRCNWKWKYGMRLLCFVDAICLALCIFSVVLFTNY